MKTVLIGDAVAIYITRAELDALASGGCGGAPDRAQSRSGAGGGVGCCGGCGGAPGGARSRSGAVGGVGCSGAGGGVGCSGATCGRADAADNDSADANHPTPGADPASSRNAGAASGADAASDAGACEEHAHRFCDVRAGSADAADNDGADANHPAPGADPASSRNAGAAASAAAAASDYTAANPAEAQRSSPDAGTAGELSPAARAALERLARRALCGAAADKADSGFAVAVELFDGGGEELLVFCRRLGRAVVAFARLADAIAAAQRLGGGAGCDLSDREQPSSGDAPVGAANEHIASERGNVGVRGADGERGVGRGLPRGSGGAIERAALHLGEEGEWLLELFCEPRALALCAAAAAEFGERRCLSAAWLGEHAHPIAAPDALATLAALA